MCPVAQSVQWQATGWTVRGSNPGGARFSAPVQTDPWAHQASCKMSTGVFPGVKSGRGVMLTPHPLLVPWSWKGRAIPLLPLWAVRPVQSLTACTRVHFTFFYTSVVSFVTYLSYNTSLKMATKNVAETCKFSPYIINSNILNARIGFYFHSYKSRSSLRRISKVVLEMVRLQPQSESTKNLVSAPQKFDEIDQVN